MAEIDKFLKFMLEQDASDIHIAVNNPPILRIHGKLERLEYQDFTPQMSKKLLFEILDKREQEYLSVHKDIDFAYDLQSSARFRCNIYLDKDGYCGAFRLIPQRIKSLQELGMPEIVGSLALKQSGMVLVTGPTGSGKSTTLAAMIDLINGRRTCHIITLEDPIEFTHNKNLSLINQRQIGIHAESFSAGLRAALREDPDVILVGEMRDQETIHLAMTAAETGLFVLGTLHTASAPKTVDRIIDVFPADQQSQIRSMLSESLSGVISQRLLKKAYGSGRIPALEIMVCNSAVRNLIREGKTWQIPSILQTGKQLGMQTMEGYVKNLLNNGSISQQEADLHLIDL